MGKLRRGLRNRKEYSGNGVGRQQENPGAACRLYLALTWALESETVGEPGWVLMGRAVAGWVRRS